VIKLKKELKPAGSPVKDYKETITVSCKPKARYAWSAGQALSKFLQGLKEGKLYGRKCVKCGRILVPPRMYCEWCYRPTDEWVEVKPVGRVVTAVVSYIAATRERLEKPRIVAIIELEGTGGNGIFHFIEGVDPKDVENQKIFGMRVKAVWKPPEEREGSVTDIMYFVPVREGEEE